MQHGCKLYQFILQNEGFKICTLPGNSNLQLKLIDSHYFINQNTYGKCLWDPQTKRLRAYMALNTN